MPRPGCLTNCLVNKNQIWCDHMKTLIEAQIFPSIGRETVIFTPCMLKKCESHLGSQRWKMTICFNLRITHHPLCTVWKIKAWYITPASGDMSESTQDVLQPMCQNYQLLWSMHSVKDQSVTWDTGLQRRVWQRERRLLSMWPILKYHFDLFGRVGSASISQRTLNPYFVIYIAWHLPA